MSKKYRLLKMSFRDTSLWLFGCEHTSDLSDSRFNALDKVINTFVTLYGQKKSIIVAERGIPKEHGNLESMVRKYQEMGYLVSVSRKHGIKLSSIETTFEKTVRRTIANTSFTSNDIIIWKMLNRLWWLHKTMSMNRLSRNFLQLSDSDKKQVKKAMKMKGNLRAANVLEYLDDCVKLRLGRGIIKSKKAGSTFASLDYMFITRIVNPFQKKTFFNMIGYEMNVTREELLADNIIHHVMQKNVLAVVGLNHLPMITKRIRSRA